MGEEFRKMRNGKQELSKDKYIDLLEDEPRGVLALIAENGYPLAVPVNFLYDEGANAFVLHSAKEGQKIDAIERDDRACLCICEEGKRIAGRWQKRVRSVVAFGRMRLVRDEEESMALARKLCGKWESGSDIDAHIEREGADVRMMVLEVEHMTGKFVVEG